MSLSLPADIEPHLDPEYDWSSPAVYALTLSRPDDLGAAWDSHFEHRPSYFDDLEQCDQVVYVGGASNLLSRLEDHHVGRVRRTALTTVCSIDSLRNVWWFDSADRAFERESGIAMTMQNQYPEMYVHCR
jgi:predicted GIY-YIG superfamily endonuclease